MDFYIKETSIQPPSGYIECYNIIQKKQTNNKKRKRYTSDTPEYKAWKQIKKKSIKFNIPIDSDWEVYYEIFLKDIGPKPSKKHRLVITNKDKGFFKDNCEWKIPKHIVNRH